MAMKFSISLYNLCTNGTFANLLIYCYSRHNVSEMTLKCRHDVLVKMCQPFIWHLSQTIQTLSFCHSSLPLFFSLFHRECGKETKLSKDKSRENVCEECLCDQQSLNSACTYPSSRFYRNQAAGCLSHTVQNRGRLIINCWSQILSFFLCTFP